MGYELRRQLREVLGPDITGLQRAVALEIADDANEATRESWASLDDLARWTGAKDAIVVRNALKRLAVNGWEFRVPIGKGKDGRVLYAVPGHRVTFRVPPFEGVATATPSLPKGEPGLTPNEQGLPLGVAGATPSGGKGVAGAHSEGAGAHSQGAGATPFSSTPSPPQVDKDSSPAAVSRPTPRAGAKTGQQKNHHLEAFGAFWSNYPLKKAYEDAKKAWIAAIERGADPKRMVDGAQAYARERRDQDPKFTKHPATWLNKGCYDDEPVESTRPQLRAVSGDGSRPFQNPTDDSVWDEDLI
ncbi:hypothetical protein ACWGDE_01535 [Streptomyces sp. NPDC054956]